MKKTLILAIALLIVLSSCADNSVKYSIISHGDDLSNMVFYSKNNQKMTVAESQKDYKVLFYLNNSCSTCMNSLTFISRLSEITKDYIDIYVLWENKIPHLDKEVFGALNNYTLKNNSISENYDTVYIVNKENIVVFKDNSNFESLILKILDLNIITLETIRCECIRYMKKHLFSNDKPSLLYFNMIGCPDCREADNIINSDEITNSFELKIISVNLGYKGDPLTTKDEIMDDMYLFKNIFNITWYPSFLVFDNITDGYNIIGKVDIISLKDELLSSIN